MQHPSGEMQHEDVDAAAEDLAGVFGNPSTVTVVT
eukprot:CAMPEP_0180431936 /NCGR_PEP_ID=MMETSP1036_2-20121128/8656_1 /TAXON_ID=632150 /ORGANISM="Azadinium spinosum, Strain 3D9" /LENGTH=34 /DNA_ID= /DNA_START= /DNA_END= /DNA_ORIENTATION=